MILLRTLITRLLVGISWPRSKESKTRIENNIAKVPRDKININKTMFIRIIIYNI